MITLLIVSIAMAATAPFLSKRSKSISAVQGVPSGAVMFFDLDRCPPDWEPVNAAWNGRYPRFSGSYTICSANENASGACSEGAVSSTKNYSRGTMFGDAIRNIRGDFAGGMEHTAEYDQSGAFTQQDGFVGIRLGAYNGNDYDNVKVFFDASRVVPTAEENRVKTVVLLGCKKR